MNERIKELAKKAGGNPNYKAFRGHPLPPPPDYIDPATVDLEKFAELMVIEFMDVVKTTANELNEHYIRQGCSEEEVLMRVNGTLAVLGHIRERFKD